MLTNLKYFLGKRRSDLASYCSKSKFLTYESLVAHLEQVGVELPTREEYEACVSSSSSQEGSVPRAPKKRTTKKSRSKKPKSEKSERVVN